MLASRPLGAVNLNLFQVQYKGMAIIAISPGSERGVEGCEGPLAAVAGARFLLPKDLEFPPGILLEGMGGLLVIGGPDFDSPSYGDTLDPQTGLEVCQRPSMPELGLLGEALDRDMPVLGVGGGMQLLNVYFGGSVIPDIAGHGTEWKDGRWVSARHNIYLSPGSKLAAILGMGGFFRVNSRHRQGLREAQRAPSLLASAYSLEDGVVEGLESPAHRWVVGVQCHPERQREVPPAFKNLFVAFAERAEGFLKRDTIG